LHRATWLDPGNYSMTPDAIDLPRRLDNLWMLTPDCTVSIIMQSQMPR